MGPRPHHSQFAAGMGGIEGHNRTRLQAKLLRTFRKHLRCNLVPQHERFGVFIVPCTPLPEVVQITVAYADRYADVDAPDSPAGAGCGIDPTRTSSGPYNRTASLCSFIVRRVKEIRSRTPGSPEPRTDHNMPPRPACANSVCLGAPCRSV